MQKAYLASPLSVILQLRVPTRTLLVLIDARAGVAAEVPERPKGPAQALPAQAHLRHALAGARLEALQLEAPGDDPRRPPHLALAFSTPRGPRTLIAEPAPRPLLLLLDGADRIVWASADRDAGPLPPDRRAGTSHPRGTPLAPGATAAPTSTATDLLASEDRRSFESARAATIAQLKSRAQKLSRALAAVQSDRAKAERAAADRHKAELILPHQGRIPRGAREAEVPDWSRLDDAGQPALVRVALDPALSAAENASRWLKKAQRMGAALPRIDARIAEVAAALKLLQDARAAAEAASDREALREAEARAGGTPKEKAARAAPGRRAERLPYRAFRSSSGARILVGRSARDNDALTLKVARGNDLWLHARGLSGSHVIVPDPGEAPDSRALGDAALLAAHFSSGRGADGVEVAWTRRKYVRKPKGAAAGAVIVTQEKSLRVRSDGERLKALLASEE